MTRRTFLKSLVAVAVAITVIPQAPSSLFAAVAPTAKYANRRIRKQSLRGNVVAAEYLKVERIGRIERKLKNL